eukprot:358989-Chlamydomonas_euryale.AAC.8
MQEQGDRRNRELARPVRPPLCLGKPACVRRPGWPSCVRRTELVAPPRLRGRPWRPLPTGAYRAVGAGAGGCANAAVAARPHGMRSRLTPRLPCSRGPLLCNYLRPTPRMLGRSIRAASAAAAAAAAAGAVLPCCRSQGRDRVCRGCAFV